MPLRPLLLITGLFFGGHGMASDQYYGDRERGWFWYEEPPVVEKPKEEELVEPRSSVAVQSAPEPLSPRELLKKQGEEWEDAMALAVMEPTPENVRNYLEKTTQIQQQAQTFSTEFKRNIWVNPKFDYSLTRPVAPEAIIAGNQAKAEDSSRQLMQIAQEKGLIFYFRSDCPYCHRFAPILKRFSESYGFTVIPVSLDGSGLPDYPYPKQNGALGHRLKVEAVPAVFMVDPDRNQVAPVGYGYRDWSKLTAQILYADEQMNGESKPAYAGVMGQ